MGMGIIKIRGRCDKRSALYDNDFFRKKPSPARVAVSAFQLHNPNRDGVPSDMKCKRPKHGLTPFRVAWPTACRFTQRPCGQYNSVGRICQISRPSCHCEGAPRPWQSVLFCASGGVLSLGFCRGGALSRPFGNSSGGGCSAPAGDTSLCCVLTGMVYCMMELYENEDGSYGIHSGRGV